MKKLSLIIIIILSLSACREEKANTKPQIESANDQNPTSTGNVSIIEPTETETTENTSITYEGTIVYRQGQTLKLLRSGNPEPQIVAEGVTESIYLSPDGTQLFYQGFGENAPAIFRANLDGDAPTLLVQRRGFSNDFWFPVKWSSDGEWLIISTGSQDLYHVVKVDGSVSHELDLPAQRGNSNAELYWLAGNNVLAVGVSYTQQEDFFLAVSGFGPVHLFDVTTGELTPIEMELEGITDYGALHEALTEADFTIVEETSAIPTTNYFANSPNSQNSGRTQTCEDWTISKFVESEPTVVYQVSNVMRIDSVMSIGEDELLFLEWTLPDCELVTPVAALKRLSVGSGEFETLTDQIFAGVGLAELSGFRFVSTPTQFAVSPDQSLVTWIGGSTTDGTNYTHSLNLLNLDTMANTVLIEALVSLRGANPEFIEAVYWVR